MKKLLIMAFCLLTVSMAQAQTQKQKVSTSEVKVTGVTKAENYAEIKFDTLRHNFGKFSKNDPIVKCSFKFKNTGTAPLVIHQAFASCGCTVPTFTKEPIKPGESGVIDVTYNGTDKFPGHFQKTVTVRSNAVSEVTRLIIEGDME
ncbi:MAG: DUF1573 domain-containing protein [Bacteroidaceae bacterium]|jgi:hypothetical protein|nr:DUF1573 domain-containing protein [Bacteroidaceae bacterium]